MPPILVAPSILAADFARLGDEIERVEAAGADWIHVDVMDGHFVDNISMGPCVARGAAAAASTPLDVHLMIDDPARYADPFIEAGAAGITFHVEAVDDPRPLLERLRERDVGAGLALSPPTPVEEVLPLLELLDLALVMTVHPGRGGQSYMAGMEEKVRAIRARAPDLPVQVDGGVAPRTAGGAAEAGATVFVAGTAIFGAPDAAAAIRAIREAALAAGSGADPGSPIDTG